MIGEGLVIGSSNSRPSWWQRAAVATDRAIAELQLDRWDVISVLGVAALFAGLWIWVHLGAALTVVGVLLLALGIAGARHAEAVEVSSSKPGRG